MTLVKFIVSKVFWKNVIYAVVFVLVAILGAWFGLKMYTGHGDFVVVPELVGLSELEASERLEDQSLSYLVIDSVWSDKGEGGTVLKQEPPFETKVKQGRSIYLTLYRYAPEAVQLNVAEGMNYKVAMIKLRNKGIEVDTIFKPNVLLHNMVIQVKQDGKKLSEDAMVKPGDKVQLVIGRRGNNKVNVPSLYGMTLDSAKKVLSASNLSIGQPFYTSEIVSSMDSAIARVYMQEPKPSGEPSARVGSNVDVFLSLKQTQKQAPDSLKTNYDK